MTLEGHGVIKDINPSDHSNGTRGAFIAGRDNALKRYGGSKSDGDLLKLWKLATTKEESSQKQHSSVVDDGYIQGKGGIVTADEDVNLHRDCDSDCDSDWFSDWFNEIVESLPKQTEEEMLEAMWRECEYRRERIRYEEMVKKGERLPVVNFNDIDIDMSEVHAEMLGMTVEGYKKLELAG